jgi:thymidylate synthase (FAD)
MSQAADDVRLKIERAGEHADDLERCKRTVALPLREVPWLSVGVENVALDWAVTEGMPEELARTRDLVTAPRARLLLIQYLERCAGEVLLDPSATCLACPSATPPQPGQGRLRCAGTDRFRLCGGEGGKRTRRRPASAVPQRHVGRTDQSSTARPTLTSSGAARVSTAGEQSAGELQNDPERSRGLINYLMRDRHGSPFEHSSMTFLITAPIFVFREFHRHRAGWSYNEESGRYRELDPVFYIPGADRKLVQQGRPGQYEFVHGTAEQHRLVDDAVRAACHHSYALYQDMLSNGIAREVARAVLPVGLYSSMYATCNARSLMHFLSLRGPTTRLRCPRSRNGRLKWPLSRWKPCGQSSCP